MIRRLSRGVVIRPISIFPGVRYKWVRGVTYVMWAALIRCYIDLIHRGEQKILWYFEPFFLPLLLPVYQGYRSVYDCVDYYPGFTKSASNQHRELLILSEYVFANSQVLSRKLGEVRPDTVAIPLGFAEHLFAPSTTQWRKKRARTFVVGYIGSISDRMDFPFLFALARRLPAVTFRFVGPLEQYVYGRPDALLIQWEKLRSLTNVQWVGSVPKQHIPRALKEIDVGLIPYRSVPFNRFSFPMKTMEYFFAGKPVVSLPIEALAPYVQKRLLFIVHNSTDAARTISHLRKAGWPQKNVRTQRLIARQNTWEKKVAAIFRMLQPKRRRYTRAFS